MAEFASKGVAGAGLGLGIAGTALGLMNGGFGLLGGCNSGWNGGGCCSENTPVNRYELNLSQALASKDTRIGLLESQVYVDQKLTDVVKDYTGQINALAAEVRANKDNQTDINREQAVYNGVNTATISCLKGQIDCLMGLTKLVEPNTSVCPGWGNVTIAPATTPATA